MKKTIAALALTSASSAMALIAPPEAHPVPTTVSKNICLQVFTSASDVSYAASCDESANNARFDLEILENGCAAGQTSMNSISFDGGETFSVEVAPCLNPNIAQL